MTKVMMLVAYCGLDCFRFDAASIIVEAISCVLKQRYQSAISGYHPCTAARCGVGGTCDKALFGDPVFGNDERIGKITVAQLLKEF